MESGINLYKYRPTTEKDTVYITGIEPTIFRRANFYLFPFAIALGYKVTPLGIIAVNATLAYQTNSLHTQFQYKAQPQGPAITLRPFMFFNQTNLYFGDPKDIANWLEDKFIQPLIYEFGLAEFALERLVRWN